MVFERKKIPLFLIVLSFNLHTIYFKYLTVILAKTKMIFMDLIIVALKRVTSVTLRVD